jgi:dolichol-phosphate mannosyltransferase
MIKFSLVVPTYNEIAHIKDICNEIIHVLETNPIEFEIIVVDDNSEDLTWQAVERLSEADGRIKLIRRTHRQGLASAVAAGWNIAEGDILGVIDADLQHPPDALSAMLTRMLDDRDVDIVIASRKIPGSRISGLSYYRRLISWLAAFSTRIFIPQLVRSIKDPMSGFFILRKKIISGRLIEPAGYKILPEVLAKGQYEQVCEVPYIFNERKAGKSKAGYRQCITSFLHIVELGLNHEKYRKASKKTKNEVF